MCGIVAILGSSEPELRQMAVKCGKKIRHRGPDWSGVYCKGKNALAHERLSIVDPSNGAQPLFSEDKDIILGVNGEIYNHVQLRKTALKKGHKFATNSDCEIILHMYHEHGIDFIDQLDGVFAWTLIDERDGSFYAARDPLGVMPLYIGWGTDGAVWISSEMKGLGDDVNTFKEFPPGHYYSSKTQSFVRYWNRDWHSLEHTPSTPLDLKLVRETLENSVVKRLMCDVPYGVLLSGGLDSSLVASIAARHVARRVEDDEQSAAWWPRLHSFSIGLEGSPDLTAAKKVADFLGTVHHEFVFTVQEGLDAVRDVIYHLETYDVTTVRASTPMYLMARMIKAMGVKMVLSGEGADELYGGYLYFHKAPNAEEFHQETVRKVLGLHSYDLLRANKSMSAWGVEPRVPFLDKEFLDMSMRINPQEKMINGERMEKWIVRKAFDDKENPYLPEEILWRQKEQFSDGVGYSWIDGLRDYAEGAVSDVQFEQRAHRFPVGTPATKEGYLFRTIFEEHYPSGAAASTVPSGPSIACSTPVAVAWDAAWAGRADPSGRAVGGVHVDSYKE